AHRYLAAGGPANVEQLLRFVADTMLVGGFGFEPPRPLPLTEVWDGAGLGRPGAERRPDRPLIGVVFYRAHRVAGNTQFVADLCAAIDAAGGDALPVSCYSLRPDAEGRVEALELLGEHGVDALVTTVLAMGRSGAAAPTAADPAQTAAPTAADPAQTAAPPTAADPAEVPQRAETAEVADPGGTADGTQDDDWQVPQLAGLGVPVIQAPACNRPRDDWADDQAGLTPLDVAMGVAIPEFDGRIVGPAFAFKEQVDDGDELGTPVIASRTDPGRVARVAGLAVRHARLRRTAPDDKRVAIVLSAYPTKRSRLGNAVGLDTPASVIDLLHALRDEGYRVDRIPGDGDALMAELADRLTYDRPTLTPEQAALGAGRMAVADYLGWFATLPATARDEVTSIWGPPPGDVYVVGAAPAVSAPGSVAQATEPTKGTRAGGGGRELVFPGLDLGGVLVTIQPPRGFGSDPIGAYHAPDVPPPHHYLAFYRWLDTGWGADAVVHVGKHGTLEWLPGKANALSEACYPDAALGEVPLVYPFVVNDPGEGTQAKRRAHAVVIDHLVPPMTRAEATDDVARLETLLDAYANAQAMDPAKLPALRRRVWELLVEAEIHRDLGLDDGVDDDEFDDMVLHVDGYLCALKDAQIRGGLHVLGRPPEGEALVDLVLAVTRLPQGRVPSLRAVVAEDLGFDPRTERRHEVDKIEAECRSRVEALAVRDWTIAPDTPATGAPASRKPQPADAGTETPPTPPATGAHASREPRQTDAGTGSRTDADTGADGDWTDADRGADGDGGSDADTGADGDWTHGDGDGGGGSDGGGGDADAEAGGVGVAVVDPVERWICARLVPALRATPDEIGNTLAALAGRYIPSGPSGAPTRGAAHVLPTGRNFYSVDPKALPSPLSWQVGQALADALVERHVAETGAPPATVGLVLWGTAAMRTSGDDAAQALALLGVRPLWDDDSGRVTGLEPIPIAELGRPRIDVTLRISGFFRDALPHVVSLLDDAVRLVAGLDESDADNPVRATGSTDARIWGPPPGGYGTGILPVIEQGSWRTDADLAEVYLAWSGFAYGRHRFGDPAPQEMRRRFAAIEVAVKNQDNREHDIFDSDDYLQDHGGMVAAVRALSGRAPRSWFGDTSDPATPRVRALAEEAARVVRSRVLNPRWIDAMRRHGYKGAFELAATVDYLFGYDATARVVEDWMYERVTEAYVGDPDVRGFFRESNPWALRAIAERLLEAGERGMWTASERARKTLIDAVLEAEGWEEQRT
ncbi:MAG TPA: cobaltochelatase subunit CobN, partial [Acidimicrobiales bacterium]|nr:cobaltochelatase subunit CobN [Acidimicrobiales bacterium]